MDVVGEIVGWFSGSGYGSGITCTQKHLVLGIENNVEMLWWAICADLIALQIFRSTHKIE